MAHLEDDEKREFEAKDGTLERAYTLHDVDVKALNRAELKCDLILVPLVTAFYLLSFIDRANIGNARVAGLQTDLGITNHQYSVALTVTYVPYILAEWPTNLLIRKLGARWVLPILTFCWGIVSMCQGFVSSYSGLIAARFFLGLTEGGLLPGIVLTLTHFFRRRRLQFRVALLFCATSLAGAFSGLLAAGIIHLHASNHAGWQWLFILEGLFTAVFGLFALLVMPSSPSTAWFLKADEKQAIEQALQNDCAGDEIADPFSWREVFAAFKAPQVLLMVPSFFFDGTTLFGLAVFSPSIVGALGFGATETQLLTVPPYAAACLLSASSFVSWVSAQLIFSKVCAAIFADHYGQRALTTIFFSVIAVVGYAVYAAKPITDKWTLYGALIMQVVGAYGTAPTISAWYANNVSPHIKRASAIAIAFSTTNCGGILSTWLYTDGPHYVRPAYIQLAFSIGVILSALANLTFLYTQNKKKAQIRAQYPNGIMPREPRVVDDSHASFVYVL